VKGGIPDNGPDVGLYLMAEVIGVARFILVKDVDGVFTDDPRRNPKATFIKEITARELLDRNLPDLSVERELLHTLENARSLTEVQVINGLKPDNIKRALDGEHVGTIIRSSRAAAK
jgi:molybdenum storage protein